MPLVNTVTNAEPSGKPVTAAEVLRQDVPIVLEGVGTVQALYTATIRSQVTGTLEEVDFSEGQKFPVVTKGPMMVGHQVRWAGACDNYESEFHHDEYVAKAGASSVCV